MYVHCFHYNLLLKVESNIDVWLPTLCNIAQRPNYNVSDDVFPHPGSVEAVQKFVSWS